MAEQTSANQSTAGEAGASAGQEEWSRIAASIGERSQRLLSEFLARTAKDPAASLNMGMGDAMSIGTAFLELTAKMWSNPQKLMQAQMSLWTAYTELWRSTTMRLMGQEAPPTIQPEKGDQRFKDEAWQQNQIFDFIKQSYLLTSRWVQATVKDVDGLDPHTQHKVDFYTRQFADALAPTNFALTNPQVLRATVESKGENLVKGLEHLLGDLEKGGGRLRVSMTDEKAFTVGENVAVTPGKVVFQNELMQLIQYTPTTAEVKEQPVLIIPPWINKYYILDLRAKNSMVKWLTDQGYTTFIVSWVNPGESLANKNFVDYMKDGAVAAKDAVLKATGQKTLNIVGYCLGGTLLACTLAYLKAKGDTSITSATFFAALVDFKEVGDLGVFIDEEQVTSLEKRMNEAGGYLDASDMATTFNMLRANDLIWSFVVNNYLLGKEPFPFDLLYWNSDSTRMPQAMHSFYLRNMYLENNLSRPGGIVLDGVPIDLGSVTVPIYMISCKEDHIAPWTSTFEATKLWGGETRFVLSGSGHIAGIVNPPAGKKYNYFTNEKAKKGAGADKWLASASEHPGSWWTDWDQWLAARSGASIPARQPGDGKLKVIEAAPGSYVKTR